MRRKRASFSRSRESFDGDLTAFNGNLHSDKNMVVFESWMKKKGKVNKGMKARYCIAYTDRKLAYFRNATDTIPAGYIDLSTVSGINMYHPQFLSKYVKNGSKNKRRNKSQSVDLSEFKFNDDITASDDFVDLYKMKESRRDSFHIKDVSFKGDNNEFAFELVTPKRVWIFSCSDSSIFTKWMDILRDLCFGKLLHCGYLRKIGQRYKTWRRRYFVVYDTNEIRYFEDDSLAIQKGKIELNQVTKITLSKPNQYHYTQCMELHTPDRVWVLATETSNDRDVWLKGIQHIMTQHQKTFVPSSSGFLSIYIPNTNRWHKHFFAVHKSEAGNRLCCFENQIQCKQLESIISFGDAQFELNCRSKMKQIISLKDLAEVVTIEAFEFKVTNEECKDDMHDKKYLFTLKLRDAQYYLAPHPNTSRHAQKWVNMIKNLRCSARQNVYTKLVRLGYKSAYISAALEQFENAYGTKQYVYSDIKGMIDRMAKPNTGSVHSLPTKSSVTSDSRSAASPISIPIDVPLTSLEEAKSISLDPDPSGSPVNASFHKVLDHERVLSWDINDVLIWMKGLENGLICKQYPHIVDGMRLLKVDG
eukprot:177372_1